MKLTISCNDLGYLVKTAGAASDRGGVLPVLSCVVIRGENGMLSVTGSDLQSQIIARLPAKFDADFAIAVNAKKLNSILGALPQDAEVSLATEAGRVVVRCGKSRFAVQTLPAEDFPMMEQDVDGNVIPVSRAEILFALSAVNHAEASNDVRYYLNGTHVSVKDGVVNVVATNGFRMAVSDVKTTFDGEDGFTLNSKSVGEIMKALAVCRDETINVVARKGSIEMTLGTTTITAKTIDGKYPDWRRVIPTQKAESIVIPINDLKSALSRARIVSDERARGVRLQVGSGTLSIEAINANQEQCTEEMDIDYNGPQITGGWNVDFLLDVVNSAKAESVKMYHNASGQPLVFESDRLKAIVMEMRL